jgi:hypothetical protein
MLITQALGTQIDLFCFSIENDGSSLNIRHPAPPGMLFRMAYPMAEVCRFATDIAFCSQVANSFSINRLDNRSRIIPQLRDCKKEMDEASSFL